MDAPALVRFLWACSKYHLDVGGLCVRAPISTFASATEQQAKEKQLGESSSAVATHANGSATGTLSGGSLSVPSAAHIASSSNSSPSSQAVAAAKSSLSSAADAHPDPSQGSDAGDMSTRGNSGENAHTISATTTTTTTLLSYTLTRLHHLRFQVAPLRLSFHV